MPALTPQEVHLRELKAKRLSFPEYRRLFEEKASHWDLRPGVLRTSAPDLRPVADGDTLCCACGRDAAASGNCHRAFAADLLAKAGWDVVLDGKPLTGAADDDMLDMFGAGND